MSTKVSNTEVDGNDTEELLPVTAIELIFRCASVVYRIDALVSDGVDTVAGGINPAELTAIVPSKPVPFTVIEELGCTAEKLVKDGGGGGGGVLLTLPPEAPPPPQAEVTRQIIVIIGALLIVIFQTTSDLLSLRWREEHRHIIFAMVKLLRNRLYVGYFYFCKIF